MAFFGERPKMALLWKGSPPAGWHSRRTTLLMVLASTCCAEEWLVQFGSERNDEVSSVTVGHKRIYAGGTTQGALGGEQKGFGDVWLSAFGEDGASQWSRQLGTAKGDELAGLGSLDEDAVCAAGSTFGDWGHKARQKDGWRGKYLGSDGSPVWREEVLLFGSAKKDDVTAVAASDDAVFLAGTTYGDLVEPQRGQGDAWIARYDATTGDLVWATAVATEKSDTLTGLAAAKDKIVACGVTFGDLDGAEKQRGRGDAWVRMLGAENGEVLWTTTVGTALGDEATAVTLFGDDVFVVGSTFGHFEFEPQFGGRDAFASKLDGLTGTVIWTRLVGSEKVDFANAVAAFGDFVYLAGMTFGNLAAPIAGKSDAWIAVLDRTSGKPDAQVQFGHANRDTLDSLAVDPSGFLVAAGSTDGHFGACNAGLKDVWLARLPLTRVPTFFSQFNVSYHDRQSRLLCDSLPVNPVSANDDVPGSSPGFGGEL